MFRKALAIVGGLAIATVLCFAPQPHMARADAVCVNYTASPIPVPTTPNGVQGPLYCVNGILQTNATGGGGSPTGTQNVFIVGPADGGGRVIVVTPPPAPTAASGVMVVTACDPTTAGRCATVSAGGVLLTTTPAPGPTTAGGISKVADCDPTTVTQCQAVSAGGVASVTTPAPAPTGAHGGVVIEGVASGTIVTVNTPVPYQTAASTAQTHTNCDPTVSLQCAKVTAAGFLQSIGYQNTGGVIVPTIGDTAVTSAAISTATTTLLIAAPGAGIKTFIMSFAINTTGANTAGLATLEYGTQATTPCDTGATSLGVILVAQATVDLQSTWPFSPLGYVVTPANVQVCVVSGGTPNFRAQAMYAEHT